LCEFPIEPLIRRRIVSVAVDIGGTGEQPSGGPLVDAADGKSTQSLRQIAAEGVIGHLAARNSDDCEGVRQKTPGSKIVQRSHDETVGEISRSAENDQAAWAGRRSHSGWDIGHYGSTAAQRR